MQSRLKQGLIDTGKVILELVLYLAISALISILLVITTQLFTSSDQGGDNSVIDPYTDLFSEYLPLFSGALLGLYIVHFLIFRRPWTQTGLIKKRSYLDFWIGGLLAFVLLLIGFDILYGLDMIVLESIEWYPITLLGFFLFFLFQSSFEEVVCRGFLIPSIERRFGVWSAILISSLLFSFVHGSNPNVTKLGLTNIFLAGLLLGILFIRYRSIWAPIGLHVFWNFLQGSVLGYEVSGLEVYSLLDTEETGNDLWTGGAFGYEGSLLASIGLLIACVLVYIDNPASFRTLSIYSHTEANKKEND